MRIFAISVIVLWCTLAASAESSQSYHDLIDAANKAIDENNFFEARNQLAGALLKSIEQSAKTSEILGIRNRLAGAYKKTHQEKTAAKLLRLSKPSLRLFAKEKYNPDVWYDAAGGVYSNVICKTRTIGIARMDKNGVITAPLESTGVSHAAGFMLLKPGDKDYELIIKHVGGLKPGESKPIPAFK
ncbi:hypothetical protein KF913_09640 [Candidatus Obscuribacterales bacterium]|nr:hypothetical protein [Candidatus Obscuribacterales bacterium]